jgi:hypothetical protein
MQRTLPRVLLFSEDRNLRTYASVSVIRHRSVLRPGHSSSPRGEIKERLNRNSTSARLKDTHRGGASSRASRWTALGAALFDGGQIRESKAPAILKRCRQRTALVVGEPLLPSSKQASLIQTCSCQAIVQRTNTAILRSNGS